MATRDHYSILCTFPLPETFLFCVFRAFYDDVTNEILWNQRLRLTEATVPLITCVPEIADKLKHFPIDEPRFGTRIDYVSNLLITLFWQCK